MKDAVEEQPWLPNGPIPLTMTWRSPDFNKLQFTATDIVGPDAVPQPLEELVEAEAHAEEMAR